MTLQLLAATEALRKNLELQKYPPGTKIFYSEGEGMKQEKLTRKEFKKIINRSVVGTHVSDYQALADHIEAVGEFAEPEPTEEERIEKLLRRVAELGGPIEWDGAHPMIGEVWRGELPTATDDIADDYTTGVLLQNLEENGFDWEMRYERHREEDPYTVKVTIEGKWFVIIRRGKTRLEATLLAWIKIKESL